MQVLVWFVDVFLCQMEEGGGDVQVFVGEDVFWVDGGVYGGVVDVEDGDGFVFVVVGEVVWGGGE